MKTKILLIALIGMNFTINAQEKIQTGIGLKNDFIYKNGNIGIGTTNPSAQLHLKKSLNTANYPSQTSRGDIFQLYTNINNSFEIGLAGASNTRRSWILSRHSDISGSFGKYYSTLHLQPDTGDKSQYRGIAIGYNTNQHIDVGTHLAVNGNVGIGTINPSAQLHLKKSLNTANYPSQTSRGDIFQLYTNINNSFEIGLAGASNTRRSWILSRHSDISGSFGKYYSTLHLQPDTGDKSQYRGIAIGYNTNQHIDVGTHLAVNGNVGIGTINPGLWKLAVNGNIKTKEIKVTLDGWSDFVFEKEYNLASLKEVESHIREKGHLKDIPSAKEVEKNGIYLGEMNSKLLQKIEELTLYTIQQQKEIENIKKENKSLKKVNSKLLELQKRLEKLENK